jgi:hypothetical protein
MRRPELSERGGKYKTKPTRVNKHSIGRVTNNIQIMDSGSYEGSDK